MVPLQVTSSSAREQKIFGDFKGDNANLEKDAPSVEESLAIGRMPMTREMGFLFILTNSFVT